MSVYAFDVAVSPHGLRQDGRRDLSVVRWYRVLTEGKNVTEAHLVANQMAGRHGMTVEVLYRE